MSLRAIRKKELSQNIQSARSHNRQNNDTLNKVKIRSIKSYPNLSTVNSAKNIVSSQRFAKSESDISNLNEQTRDRILNTKSEVCLKTISVHNTMASSTLDCLNQDENNKSQRNYVNQQRRFSERTDYSTSHLSTITSNTDIQRGFADTSNIRIPIIGYEVMEERARFTVFKLRIENPFTNDCWLVLRRYTDFVRLNNKLKTIMPNINLYLPRKKIFGDNFNAAFLDNRVQGLQLFVNTIMSNNVLKNSQIVREFFCLDEAPIYSESMEECRAIFEAQEETIAHLKLQLSNRDETILAYEKKISSMTHQNELLQNAFKHTINNCSKCSKDIDNYLKDKSNEITNSDLKINL